MAGKRHSVACALAVALMLPLAVAGCGRKGPLDPPPSAATPPPPNLPPQAPPSTTGLIDPLTPTGQAQQAPPSAPAPTTQAAAAAPQGGTHPLWSSFVLDPLIK